MNEWGEFRKDFTALASEAILHRFDSFEQFAYLHHYSEWHIQSFMLFEFKFPDQLFSFLWDTKIKMDIAFCDPGNPVHLITVSYPAPRIPDKEKAVHTFKHELFITINQLIVKKYGGSSNFINTRGFNRSEITRFSYFDYKDFRDFQDFRLFLKELGGALQLKYRDKVAIYPIPKESDCTE